MRSLALLRVGVFVAAVVWPLATMRWAGGAMANEQRRRQPMPVLSVARTQFPEQFDAYFRDNFGWRDRLVRWHNRLKFRYFGESPVAQVIVGREGWLFYSAVGDDMDIRNFAGRWPHRPSDIETWLRRQDARQREYAALGARYLVVVAPDKQTMYPELVPPRYGPPAPGVLTETLQHLRSHPRLQFLDLRPVLQPHRDAQLYFKGGSHWNSQGAFHAARAIVDRLRPSVPGIGVIDESDYTLTASHIDSADLVRMLALDVTVDDRVFTYQRRTPAARQIRNEKLHDVWEQPGSGLPRAVLLGDSFGVALAPILADGFSRLYHYQSSHGGSDPNVVLQERPDVIVLIVVERRLPALAVE